ncbi:hypothetical protein [Myroides sp. WP-1]|uniref:hypothetical protein n=1 Tax=Myroides sp. WP-1 TaxID=2759944 RepID=UPI0015FB7976|nr:hypothetical protein [Myroides sp. WP-1]MBB1139179.1 hypothetical protein [Myroides sp. WP-1]
MKKFLILGLILMLFSCSKEDGLVESYQSEKETKTKDANIGYKSPYNYTKLYNLESGSISYSFSNTTSLEISITPYFGIAFYTGDSTYSNSNLPILNSNGVIYTNFMSSENFTIKGNSSYSNKSDITSVPTNIGNGGQGYFNFPLYSPNTGEDLSILTKRGKLYFIEVYVRNELIGYVKIPIKYDFDSTTGLSYPWESLNINDSFFGHELIYNRESLEICSTIRSTDVVKDYLKFVYEGSSYEISAEVNTSGVEFKMIKI